MSSGNGDSRPLSVGIVGGGFGGVGIGIRLQQAGIDEFTIFERGETVGGVWRANTYPGAACDVPSHLYSFSFAPGHRWSRRYAPQAEILAYLEDCVDRFGLDRLSLADALAEQWEEMQVAGTRVETPAPASQADQAAENGHSADAPTTEDELRVLLEEAQAARDELTLKTDELATRLAALETLVVGVTAALAELRPANGGATPKRSRSSTKRAAAPAAP